MTGSSIRFKRGNKADLPQSASSGTPLWCEDSQELYVGTGNGVAKVGVVSQETDTTNSLNLVGIDTNDPSILKKNTSITMQGGTITAQTFIGDFSGNATSATKDANGNNIAATYLPKSGGTVTGTLDLTKVTDVSGIANNSPALRIGAISGEHLEFDGNEIHAKASGTTVGTLNLNVDGGDVCFNGNTNKVSISGGNVTATKFTGALNGNATSATKATQDGNGNTISSTYVNLTGAQTITGAKTISSTLTLSKTTDASGTANNSPALIVGGTATTSHLELDNNEIMAKTNGTSVGELSLNNEGGDININGSNSANLVKLGSHRIQFGGVATINYNSTNQALEFTFA